VKFIYAVILCISFNLATAQEWEKIASHRFHNDNYVVYKSQNENFTDIAKICIEDYFGGTIHEFPIELGTDIGGIHGGFKFFEVFGQKTLLYNHTFHNRTSIVQLFNLNSYDSKQSQELHIYYLDVDRLLFDELPIEKKRFFISTKTHPIYDSTRIEIVTWSKGVTWDITANGNISGTRIGTKRWYMIEDERYAPWLRDFESESILTEDVPNSTVYFEGPWSKNPGSKMSEDLDNLLKTYSMVEVGIDFEWITVFTAQLSSNKHIRISYLEDEITDCHACPTRVKAQILSEPAGKIIKELELNIGTSWGKANSSFKLHKWNNQQLLSYEHQYGNQGNNSSYIHFFDIDNITTEPVAKYSFPVSADHSIHWTNLPQAVKDEFISCTPFEIDPETYIHHAIRFYPSYNLNTKGDLVLSYSSSNMGFEPISWEHCREFMNYTLPDRVVILQGPLSMSPGKFISVANGRKKKTGFDLEATDGSEDYYEILKGTISN
jgi:hypothetical protein